MNRRRFLIYAGTAVAVVGASILGLNQMIKQPETTLSQTSGTESISVFQSSTSTAMSVVESTTSTLPLTVEGAYNRLYFLFDPHLNNVREETERLFGGLDVSSAGTKLDFQKDGYVNVPKNKLVNLQIEGVAPNGKALTNCTSSEPLKPLPLTNAIIDSLDKNLFLGLADGPATCPIKPSELDIASVFRGPDYSWLDRYYPQSWPYAPNYFLYGYRIDSGPYTGQPHLAFDIMSPPGTRVHAPWGGEIVRGLYDWRFGIANEFGVLYLNHIDPTVSLGQHVSRYDVVATRNSAQSHVHLEYRDLGFSGEYGDFEHSHPERILELFTTMKPEDLLKNPLLKDPIPILPYFGP